MCTTVVSIDPRSAAPVLMAGVRDEFLDRPWLSPGRHWAARPHLVGGRDSQASGTWLAVNPSASRVACVLNAHGLMAEESRRVTRGELPLHVADGGEPGELDLPRYDPFHLVCATPGSVRLWSWDGRAFDERVLEAGLHLVVNGGLEGAVDDGGPGAAQMRARVEYFRPLFEKATRPEPRDGATENAWGDWLSIAGGAGLDPADPRALVLRRTIDDQQWGTSSLSLVALSRAGVRYDFCADPVGSPPAWSHVL
jgi:hypothetical protein